MKSYKKPVLNVERFTANEFVAACGDTNYQYLFECDAMGGYTGTVFYSDGDDKFEPFGDDKLMGIGYHACGEKHRTEFGDEFIEGWYVTGKEGISGGKYYKKVIIWKGPDGNNIHCTTELDMSKWDEAKS